MACMTSTTDAPTPPLTDPRPILDRALASGAAVVADVRPDQLTGPTPCPDMDVRTMLGHLIGVLGRIAALGNGDDPFAVAETPVPDDDWSAAWAAAGEKAAAAWSDDALLEKPMALPWIQGTGADILTSYFSELTVHTWDLAVATGQQPEWDEVVVNAALDAPPLMPAENRRELFEQISAAMGFEEVNVPFGEAVIVSADAPAIDRLVAWNGRNPRP